MQRRNLIAAALAAGIVPAARAAAKPVVIELFTSQGCSSCPPADALLGQLTRRSEVIALAWHVDYWDHLGWRDKFASRTATTRQQAYARQLGGGVFTPALVVDGTNVVVGSDRASVEAAIAAAAALPVAVTLSRAEDTVAVAIGAAPGPVHVQRIVYDPEHATDVGAGENDGTRLREYRIAREVEALAEWDGGARRLTAKPPGPGQGLAIIVQSADLRILGAADLPPSRSGQRRHRGSDQVR
ncbi:MAG TPA: DUF1223 domain-containing protein [Acetobacteraceae bacterium]|nr:DUF1223 domain-containing protein [Acetobacteraceae bacterium]